MVAKFEIRTPKSGEYNWVLLSQGRTLATGESYTTKASAEKAIASMRQAAANATVVDRTLPPARTPAGTAARTAGPAKETVRTAKRTAKKTGKKAKATAKNPNAKKGKAKGKKSRR